MQGIYPIGHKILCDGYVTDWGLLNFKSLKINIFLCDGYVIKSGLQLQIINEFLI